ncbi:vesicle-associated membrane protein-associated protein A-like [Watersipora subatra]|uniref:vesicle-associated membrane protein-associated protein A-like n=1 Tax=Watersipora subatra TaxID=2589382 RepID=UPI00355C990B
MALKVQPEDIIQFKGSLTEVVTTDVSLTNQCEEPLAFKVKTTAPRRYAVRPNSGSLTPGETLTISVMRQPADTDVPEKARHKFMIQSVKVKPGQNLATVWTDTDPSTFMETKLRVQFDDVPPSNRSSVTDEDYHRVLDDNTRLSRQLDSLQSEKASLQAEAQRRAAAKAQQEMNMPGGLSLLFHDKKNLVLMLVLLAVAFFTGLLTAETILSPASSDM